MPELRHHSVQVPATSANIGAGFDVFGFAVDLHLAVRSRPRSAAAERVTVLGEAAEVVPSGDDNLIWRSLVTFCERHDVAVPDVQLVTACRIPFERGLGSSSAAIVAGLVLGRALTATAVGDRDLVGLAAELEGHADNVGPALLGGLVACARDDDGQLIVRRVNPAVRLRPLALVPDARQATSSSRAVLPESLRRGDVIEQVGRAGHVLGALTGQWPVAVGAAGDRLHEPERLETMGHSGRVVGDLRAEGVHAWLSGAGPSVMTAVAATDAAASAAVATIAEAHGFALLELAFDLSGALSCPDDGCALAGGGDCVQCPELKVR